MFNFKFNAHFMSQMGQFFRHTVKQITPLFVLFRCFGIFTYCFAGLMLVSFCAKANYSPTIQNPNDGYILKLAGETTLDTTPITGSDGKNYYLVGEPIVIEYGSPSISMKGTVKCAGKIWGNTDLSIPYDKAFHRLFIYTPLAGININGKIAYRINSNVIMTVESYITYWKNFDGTGCANTTPTKTEAVSFFVNHFPITITFYVHEEAIDGQIVFPEMAIGGYVRAFMDPKVAPAYDSWPIEQSTAPLRLASAVINIPASCSTTTSTGQAETLNLRHGKMTSIKYDSLISEKIYFDCEFSKSVGVRLRLDYATDDDTKKRLPMINRADKTKKIYSELTMTDESTGQTGTDFKVNIQDLNTVTVSSHIQGENAAAGDYQGSAWLIATFD